MSLAADADVRSGAGHAYTQWVRRLQPDFTVFLHVPQRFAKEAGDSKRVFFRQWAQGIKQVRQGAAAQILSDQIGPALLFNRDEPEDKRVVQLPANVLLALEA